MQQNIENSLRDMEVGSYQTLDRRSRKGESNWGTQREGVQKSAKKSFQTLEEKKDRDFDAAMRVSKAKL